MLSAASQSVNTQCHGVTFFQIPWFGFLTKPDSGRCAGSDDIARQQGHEAAYITYQVWYAENHIGGVAILNQFIIYRKPKTQIVRVGYFISGRHEWAQWRKGVAAFSLTHCPPHSN